MWSSTNWLRAACYCTAGVGVILSGVGVCSLTRDHVHPKLDHRKSIIPNLDGYGTVDGRDTIRLENPKKVVEDYLQDKKFYRVDDKTAEVWISNKYRGVVLIERKH